MGSRSRGGYKEFYSIRFSVEAAKEIRKTKPPKLLLFRDGKKHRKMGFKPRKQG